MKINVCCLVAVAVLATIGIAAAPDTGVQGVVLHESLFMTDRGPDRCIDGYHKICHKECDPDMAPVCIPIVICHCEPD